MNQASVRSRTGTGMWGRKTCSNALAIFSLLLLPVLGTRRSRMGKESALPDGIRRINATQFWARTKAGRLCLWLWSKRMPTPGALVVSQDQGIVDDQIYPRLWQGFQKPVDLRYRQCLGAQGPTLQELVIGGPMATKGDAAECAGDPAFGGNQAAAEKFEEGTPRAGRHDRQKVGNPFRQAEGNEAEKGHGSTSEKPKTLLIGRPFSTRVGCTAPPPCQAFLPEEKR